MFGRVQAEPLENVRITSSNIVVVVRDPMDPEKRVKITIGKSEIIKPIFHIETKPTLMFRIVEKCSQNIQKLVHNVGPNEIIGKLVFVWFVRNVLVQLVIFYVVDMFFMPA